MSDDPERVLYADADSDAGSAVVAAVEASGLAAEVVATAGDALGRLDAADCLVVGGDLPDEPWDGLVESAVDRRPTLPVVTFLRKGSEATATTALRAGATDYVPRDAGVDGLLERVRNALDGSGPRATAVDRPTRELRENQTALGKLYDISTDPDRPVDERIREMLELGRVRLDVGSAFLARVDLDAGDWRVRQAVGDTDLVEPGMETGLENTYCRRTVESEGLLGVHDAVETEYGDHAAHRDLGVACYLGGKVVVDGRLYGTVCFADGAGREPFTDSERAFVEVLVTWLGYEIQRSERERRLRSARDRVENTLERIGDAFVGVNTDWEFTYVNERAGELLQRDPDALVGAAVWEELPATDDSQFERRCREALADQEPVTFEEHFEPLGRWFEVSAYPDEDGLSVFFRDVTGRVQRKRELQHYERVLGAARGMVYALDDEGRITVMSEPLAEFLGYDRETVLGEPIADYLDGSVLERGRRAIRRLSEGDEESTTIEADVEDASGDVVPVEVELSTLSEDGEFRGTVGVVYDRSDLAAVQQRLQRERDRFSFLFEFLPDPVTEVGFVDGEPVLRSVNAAFRETFCPDADEVVGRSVNDFVFLADGADDDGTQIDERILAGESVTTEVRRETVGGPRDFLFRGVPYLGDDVVDGPRAFGIYTDITEQKRYERRLEVLHRVLRHNLRNRTTAIEGYARRVAAAVDDPDLAASVEKLRENTEALGGLNDKAQAIERAASPAAGEEGPVDAAELVRTVAEGYDDRGGATVETDLPPECPVAADERLATAVENLVENGLEHGDTAWVRVGIDASDRGDDWVAITVTDDGPGIPDHERAVVGGERDITQLEHGSGLGLWLVRWVVEAVGGEIEFRDRDGGGTVVVLHLRRSD